MLFKDISPTKGRIYNVAIDLFSEYGYDRISMRYLAKAVGIKHASIYNHFKAKKDILMDLFAVYTRFHETAFPFPDYESILKMAETMPPIELLMMLDYRFPDDIKPSMTRILTIAVRSMSVDMDSRQFIYDNVLLSPVQRTKPVVQKLIELGRIKPFDVESFISLLSHYCFSAVALSTTPFDTGLEGWTQGLKFLYTSFIVPTGE